MLENEIKELELQIEKYKEDVNYFQSLQLGLKLVLNGSYGALCAPYFVLFNNQVAGTITAEGRELTKTMSHKNEDYWYNMWHLDVETHNNMHIKDVKQIPNNQSVSVYGDSIDGKSIIDTDKGKYTIEELYNMYNSKSIRKDKEVIPVDFKSLNWTNDKNIHYSDVKNIIRHKTSKKKYRLKVGGKDIIITGDHSLVVFRDGKQLNVKPHQLLSSDKVLIYKNKTYGDTDRYEESVQQRTQPSVI